MVSSDYGSPPHDPAFLPALLPPAALDAASCLALSASAASLGRVILWNASFTLVPPSMASSGSFLSLHHQNLSVFSGFSIPMAIWQSMDGLQAKAPTTATASCTFDWRLHSLLHRAVCSTLCHGLDLQIPACNLLLAAGSIGPTVY